MTRVMVLHSFETAEKVPVIIDVQGKNLTITQEKVKRNLPKYWSKEYIHECLSRIENHRHKMLFVFLWQSGVRITEAISLKKKDIDFKNSVMRVKWQKNRKHKVRVVPLHPTLSQVLEVYTAPLKADDRVFSLTRQRAWQLSKKYFGGHPHQFRHSFAVNWLRQGGDLIVLHRILGHSRIQTTMEYLKIVPTDQAKELLKIVF